MKAQRLIRDLQTAGLTQEQIGAIIGMDQSNVSRLARGNAKNLTYERGAALIALHCKHCGKRK